MVAFLDCVQQFKEEVEKGDTGFCLPYRSDNQNETHTHTHDHNVFPWPPGHPLSCIGR